MDVVNVPLRRNAWLQTTEVLAASMGKTQVWFCDCLAQEGGKALRKLHHILVQALDLDRTEPIAKAPEDVAAYAMYVGLGREKFLRQSDENPDGMRVICKYLAEAIRRNRAEARPV